jgi:hypothetical protein
VGTDLTETTADPHPVIIGSSPVAAKILLRNVNGAWKVKRRTIVLDANVLLDKNLSVFL